MDITEQSIVTVYGLDGKPFYLSNVDKITSNYIEVLSTRFSKKTGKVLKQQPDNYGSCYKTPESEVFAELKETVLFKDISSKIEIFDCSNLQTIQDQKDILISDSLELGQSDYTISTWIEDIQKYIEKLDIPDNATVLSIDSEKVRVGFERIESISEYNYRVFWKPAISSLKAKQERDNIDQQITSLQAKRDQINHDFEIID